jgi:hypothetical protein
MRVRRWKRIACAALLLLTAAGAYKTAAMTLRARPCTASAPEAVVHGRRLVTFAGYELNISFTPAGRLVGFDIAKD